MAKRKPASVVMRWYDKLGLTLLASMLVVFFAIPPEWFFVWDPKRSYFDYDSNSMVIWRDTPGPEWIPIYASSRTTATGLGNPSIECKPTYNQPAWGLIERGPQVRSFPSDWMQPCLDDGRTAVREVEMRLWLWGRIPLWQKVRATVVIAPDVVTDDELEKLQMQFNEKINTLTRELQTNGAFDD